MPKRWINISFEKNSDMQKISTFLWFDNQAEEAAHFYVSIFRNSSIGLISYYGDGGPGPKGTVMVVEFELEGQSFYALNGGPLFRFNESISLYVNCETQREVDRLWDQLLADGGTESQCGWLKDKYGLSWQIIPGFLTQYLTDKDPARAQRVMTAMLKMQKLDIALLQKAYDGK
jgi:predicted 3-demethylubiquinone-9 3-methyltransferase (glyoxalase superfamily)